MTATSPFQRQAPQALATLRGIALGQLLHRHPEIGEFLDSVGLHPQGPDCELPLEHWLLTLPDEAFTDAGMEARQIHDHIAGLLETEARWRAQDAGGVDTLTICGGRNKTGEAETVTLSLRRGEVVCIVGPTGSGKSRLLGDIECLAQGDTPTGRRVLVNGLPPDPDHRFSLDKKLVAQISQNMNFVVDLSVEEFILMHAQCRRVSQPAEKAREVIDCANSLTGEKFSAEVSVTQLSGGQTRALMIADVALLSASPVVLIDEIENAGVDRRRALELLVAGDKIVLISTHDPLLALGAVRRVVIRNGGIAALLETSPAERAALVHLEEMDRQIMGIRDRLRSGQRIEALAALSASLPAP